MNSRVRWGGMKVKSSFASWALTNEQARGGIETTFGAGKIILVILSINI